MVPHLNHLARTVAGSATMSVAAAASRHPDPISMTVGEPAESPPEGVREAARRAIVEGRTRYGPAGGLPELRAALAAEFGARTGVAVDGRHVVVTCGGKAALMDALRCLVDPGDEVLVPAPYWPSFLQQVQWCGARAVVVSPDESGLPSAASLARAAGPRARVLVLNSPNNPTGRILSPERQAELLRVARERDLWIVSDEVYRSFAFDGVVSSMAAVAGAFDRVVTVESFSKRFSMTGYRVGAAIAPPEVVEAMTRVAQAATTHAATASQHAACAALEVAAEWDEQQRRRYRARRDRAHELLTSLPGVRCALPEGAFYLLPDVREWCARRGFGDTTGLVDWLRDEHGLGVTPGEAFGIPGHLRLSLGLEDARLDEALERLRRAAAH